MVPRPPVLLLHGASCDARIWQSGFQQALQQLGWDCRVLDLPGHGTQRPPPGRSLQFSLDDYAVAVAEAVAACPRPPALIGHSMGGFLAQRHVLAGGHAAALVLLASAPAHGMAREVLAFALRHPLLSLRLDLAGGRGPRAQRLERVRAMLMTPATPDETVARVADLLQPESPLALRELTLGSLPTRPLDLPVLVIAGGRDALIGVPAQRSLASSYGVALDLFPDMAHMLQVEPGWPQVVDRIADFLRVRLSCAPSGPAEEQVGGA